MRRGRVVIWTLDSNKKQVFKSFNFVMSRKVPYLLVYNILRKLPNKGYVLELSGKWKRVHRNPAVSFGQVCASLRDFRFEVMEKIEPEDVKIPTRMINSIWFSKQDYLFIKSIGSTIHVITDILSINEIQWHKSKNPDCIYLVDYKGKIKMDMEYLYIKSSNSR